MTELSSSAWSLESRPGLEDGDLGEGLGMLQTSLR